VLDREFDFIAYRNEFVEKFRGLGRPNAFALFGVAVGSAFEGMCFRVVTALSSQCFPSVGHHDLAFEVGLGSEKGWTSKDGEVWAVEPE
jgi:hypothetical protein